MDSAPFQPTVLASPRHRIGTLSISRKVGFLYLRLSLGSRRNRTLAPFVWILVWIGGQLIETKTRNRLCYAGFKLVVRPKGLEPLLLAPSVLMVMNRHVLCAKVAQ